MNKAKKAEITELEAVEMPDEAIAARKMSEPELPANNDFDDPEIGEVDTSYFLVGVGASAGGLEAIKTFLAPIPANCPHSFIFIQHMSPDYKSVMGELLSRETSLIIAEVEDNMVVQPGHVYIVPPNANVIIRGTHVKDREGKRVVRAAHGRTAPPDQLSGLHFSLVKQPPRPQLNLPIDLIFQSLAEAVGERAVAVILSGTGSDGSRGLRAIKDCDGMVMVQDPETAAFDGMPKAAIGTHLPDMVLPPDQMARELYRYFDLHRTGSIQLERVFEGESDKIQSILNAVSKEARIDFSQYKMPTLQRRIARRMTIKGCANLDDYLKLLESTPDEGAILCREFLVGVTHFFRDYPGWETLRRMVLPELFANHQGEGPIKIWSVGCSTGEEAYTIAMLMDSYQREVGARVDYRIFATDVNELAIAAAKEGIYPESALEDVPDKYVADYLSFRRGGVYVSENIRNKIVFSTHNVATDPPYIHTDLIVCRNMLIYMAPALQSQVLTTFSFALRPGGFLFLGASETIERSSSRFQPVDVRWRIFSNVAKASARDASRRNKHNHFPPTFQPAAQRVRNVGVPSISGFNKEMLSLLLTEVDSCAIMINDNLQVIETFGDYRNFLTLPDTGFSANLPDLVPERLVSTLSIVVRRANKEGVSKYGPVKIVEGQNVKEVQLQCVKTANDDGGGLYAVIFRQLDKKPLSDTSEGTDRENTAELREQARYVNELEAELAATRETLEATVEDLGVSNEELQTSNEELMSANEELQSTNEEMQSVNEELHTINGEHGAKISELEAAYADIDNLLNSTDVATVFLDRDLRIRRFSETINTHFKLTSRDVGRPLSHFSSSLDSDANRRILIGADQALQTGEHKSYEVRSTDDRWYQVKVRPFEDTTGLTAGVVMTFVDITSPKSLQAELRLRRDMLEALIEGQIAGYWDWKIPEGVEYLSPRLKGMLGYEDHEIDNEPSSRKALMHPDDVPIEVATFEEHVRTRGAHPYSIEVRYLHKDGSMIWVLCRGSVIEWGAEGEPLRMTGLHIDITELKHREQDSLRRAEEIQRFAYISAHDLREPMRAVENMTALLAERMEGRVDGDDARLMHFITDASARMKGMIDGVLDYANLQDGNFESQTVDMTETISAILGTFAEIIGSTHAKVVVDELPPCHSSEKLVGRVVQNLFSNALKFRHPDRPLTIRVTGRTEADGQVCYSVQDNGIGIEPKFREKVFDIFYRLHTQAEYKGEGLGMSLCRKMVDKMGGRIWIDDGLDGGVSVKFTLPGPKED